MLDAALGLLGFRGYGADDRGWIAVVLAGLTMLGLKVALIMFLVRLEPHLGPYRRVVLVAATVVGMVGAVSNVIAFPIPPGPAG